MSRQPPQFLVHHLADFLARHRIRDIGRDWGFARLGGAALAPGTGFAGQAGGDAVQEAADGLPATDGARLAGQDEEGGLEDVLGVVEVAEEAAADAQHQPPVALHQRREGRLVAAGGEALQQLPVAQCGQARGRQQPAQVPC